VAPYTKSPGNIEDLRAATGFQIVQLRAPYLMQTLLATYAVFTVLPVSQLTAPQNGPSSAAYGPIAVNSYNHLQCTCYAGWGGSNCGTNLLCNICLPGFCPVQQNGPPCSASVIFSPMPRIGAPFRYDLSYNSLPPGTGAIMTLENCPLFTNAGPPAVECDLHAYGILLSQYCANGVPRETADGVFCDCNPGWTYWNPNNLPVTAGCTIADPAPGANRPGNCPVHDTTCDSYGYQQRPASCQCGGHGLIDATGSCICDVNFLKDQNGCCSIANNCPYCGNITGTHIVGCDKTATGAVNQCSAATSDGVWGGTCCNVFMPVTTACSENGLYVSGEYVFTYTNNALVPVVYPGSPFPSYNPNGAFCNCANKDRLFTGVSCNQPSCPTINGAVCSNNGICNNGVCLQNGVCANGDFYGCACQFNLNEDCRGGTGLPLCSARGTCGAPPTQTLTLQCACDQGYGGPLCATSACGATDCNAANQGGSCVYNATGNSFSCSCRTDDPFICDTHVGCLWAGPTCDFDVTQGCGAFSDNHALLCNNEGSCNTTGFPTIPPVCVCRNGWVGPDNQCQTQPCSPNCGPHGHCIDGFPPTCTCDPHWSPTGGSFPCTISDCVYGFPNVTTGLCQCNNSAYSYSSNCTQLSCNSFNGVSCGQVNCALQTSCRQPDQTCRPGCAELSNSNTCRNGTCTCHWSSNLDPVLGYCVSRCAPWPATTSISSRIVNGQQVFDHCNCELGSGLDPNFGCFESVCKNGGEWLPEPGACRCTAGWNLPNCDTEYCSGHGFFNNGTTNDCSCLFPWIQPTCSQWSCLNGGFPVANPVMGQPYKCQCPLAYIGMNCEFDQCQPNGRASPDGSSCICNPGYGGVHCEVFGCYYPNMIVHTPGNDSCACAPNYFGSACQWLKCGPAGSYINGTCNGNATAPVCVGGFTGGVCACGGVSLPRMDDSGFVNCTGNSCGEFGLPTTNLGSCDCNSLSTFRPQLDSNHSFNCVPNCQNGGTYNNTVPIGCNCPPHTAQPICLQLPISSSSSSTGSGSHSSSSSSTGGGGTNAAHRISVSYELMSGMAALLVLTLRRQ
jgi:hypothetical protein